MQLRFLVRWGLADVEDASQHAGPFQLLRGVIARQIVIPEVYDVMKNVQDLMVRAQVQLPRYLLTLWVQRDWLLGWSILCCCHPMLWW